MNKMGFRIKWLGCAGYEMDFGGFTVVNDPWVTDNPKTDLDWEIIENCDVITVTHTHYDHITDIPMLLEKFNPKLLTGEMTAISLLKWLDMCPMKLYSLAPNIELDFDAVKIKTLYGTHTILGASMSAVKERLMNNPTVTSSEIMQELNMIGSIEYRNFLFTMPNGTKILVWGNELTPEQKNIIRSEKPDVAIMQMTKNSPAETAELCLEIGSKVVIASHIDCPKDYMHLAVELGEEFKKRNADVNYIIPEYGKWMEL